MTYLPMKRTAGYLLQNDDRRISIVHPRKRLRRNHSEDYFNINNNNHNNNNRNYMNDTDNESIQSNHTNNTQISPLRTMSQVVLSNQEEIEFEFNQCLRLYIYQLPATIKRKSAFGHISSQIVSGVYGNRNNIKRTKHIKSRNTKISKKNPWDRKMIDFLQHVTSIHNIFVNNNNMCDWVNASLAINCCIKIYSHRIDHLQVSVHKLLTMCYSNINANKTINCTQKQKQKQKTKRMRRTLIALKDIHKINIQNKSTHCNDTESAFVLDKFNIIRLQNSLIIESNEWWLDKATPWQNDDGNDNDDRGGGDDDYDVCKMILNALNDFNTDFSCSTLIDNDISNFFHSIQNNVQYIDDNVTIISNNRNQNRNNWLLSPLQCQSVDSLSINALLPRNCPTHNFDNLFDINVNQSDIIGSVVDMSPNMPLTPIISNMLNADRTPPRRLLSNRITTPIHTNDSDSQSKSTVSTFHSENNENNDNDDIDGLIQTENIFKLPTLINEIALKNSISVSTIDMLNIKKKKKSKLKSKRKKKKRKKKSKKKQKSNKKKKKTTKKKKRKRQILNEISMNNNDLSPQSKRRRLNVYNDDISSTVCMSTPSIHLEYTPNIYSNLNHFKGYNSLNNSLHSLHSIGSGSSVEIGRGNSNISDLDNNNDMLNVILPDNISIISTPPTSVSCTLLTPQTIHNGITYSKQQYHNKIRSVLLPGVIEENNDQLNINILSSPQPMVSPLRLQFDHDEPIQLIQKRRTTIRRRKYFDGREIHKVNQCTFDILINVKNESINNNNDYKSNEYECEPKIQFSEILELQHEQLQNSIPNISVATSFLSLLTVCSDSYHCRQHDNNVEMSFSRKETGVMGDFIVDIT